MKKSLCHCKCGQALIESLVTIIAISMIIMGSLSTLYFCFSKLWLRHFTHETLMCLASQKSPSHCQQEFIKNMHSSLPFGRLMVDEIYIRPDRLAVRARWSFGLQNDIVHRSHFRIKEYQELEIPIVPPQTMTEFVR